jgi:hypothetical protein
MPQLQISLPPLSSLRRKTLGTKENHYWRYCFVFVEIFLTWKKYHKDEAFSLKGSLSHVKPCLNPLSGFRGHVTQHIFLNCLAPISKSAVTIHSVAGLFFKASTSLLFPFFLWYLTGTTEKKNMEQVFRPSGFTLHPKENLEWYSLYHIGYICFNWAWTFAMHNHAFHPTSPSTVKVGHLKFSSS